MEKRACSIAEGALAAGEARLNRTRMGEGELRQRMEAAGWEESDIEDQLADMERNRKSAACGPRGSVIVPPAPGSSDSPLEIACEEGLELTAEDIAAITEHCRREHPGCRAVIARVRDDELGYEPRVAARGFERIRRITGYLVGTLDRFNNGKAAEERDRVKHSVVSIKQDKPE